MIIKVSKIINCSSEHPSYPSSNLLEHPPKCWRCAKPNEPIATIILQLAQSSCITGLEIGNYRTCIVIVEASTSSEPDKWLPLVDHQFLCHDEAAANSKFRDQVQIFTKRDLNPDTVKIKFDRVKVTCTQSANPRELFGLEFIILRTEVVVDLGLDVFGRFKLKEKNDDKDELKEKYLKVFSNRKTYKEELKDKITESGMSNFTKEEEENREPKKRRMLEKLEADSESAAANAGTSTTPSSSAHLNDESTIEKDSAKKNKDKNASPVAWTLFGDVIPSPKPKKVVESGTKAVNSNSETKKRPHSPLSSTSTSTSTTKKVSCSLCEPRTDELCETCNLLPNTESTVTNVRKKKVEKAKPKKEFAKLFEDVSFSLSGYVNPQRDDIRRKALKMGAKYIADPNTSYNKCTHLISASKNTPKSQQLKGHCKIVNHKFIQHCFNKQKRIPWRRYAHDSNEQSQPESEEDVTSPIRASNIYEEDTDESDSDY